ncbi:MAG: hypothetical protein QOD53_2460, partial [Thermoleophilaceae bacterium]|nr:hypothetical protein [Thermoleophilaceae bacterium]
MHDAVVVGSGAAGGWAAKELCDAGLDVLLLEAGRAIDPGADFPLPAPPERRVASRVGAALRGQPVQMRCAAFDARTRRFFVNDRDDPYTTPPGDAFNWFRGRQVGGRLHVWGRVALRLSEEELADWPLAAADLAPFYDEVEGFIGVRDAEPTPAERRFADAVADDVRVEPTRLAAHDPARVPATIRAAEASGRLTLRPDAVVRRVTLDPGRGRAGGVELADRATGQAVRVQARLVVLCAGTIDTLRILLASGIGASSGRLGRYLTDHVMTGIGGRLAGHGAAEPARSADPYDFGTATG